MDAKPPVAQQQSTQQTAPTPATPTPRVLLKKYGSVILLVVCIGIITYAVVLARS